MSADDQLKMVIRRLRRLAGLSVEEAAELVGLNVGVLRGHEDPESCYSVAKSMVRRLLPAYLERIENNGERAMEIGSENNIFEKAWKLGSEVQSLTSRLDSLEEQLRTRRQNGKVSLKSHEVARLKWEFESTLSGVRLLQDELFTVTEKLANAISRGGMYQTGGYPEGAKADEG